jgi:Na+/H+ antiporter NhaC
VPVSESKSLILKSNALRPALGLILGLGLAGILSWLLPTNDRSVFTQQVIAQIPRIAAKLGDGPWTHVSSRYEGFDVGFEEASRRRATSEGKDPSVTFSCTEVGGEIVLSGNIPSGSSERVVIKAVDGWSLFPPIAAILVAIFSGRLLLGLSLAILTGGFLAVPESLPLIDVPGFVIRKAVLDFLWAPLESSFQLYILAFTAALIGMVKVTLLSGGNAGIANLLASRAQGARSTRVAAFLMGLAIFFDDYANTIVVGSTLRPIADRFRVSREKLAYIVDSTAAPIAGVAVISTWIGYEVGLFDDLMRDLRTGISGYQLFFSILLLRFYCLFTLAFVAASSWFQRDFGPMLRAERRAQSTGQVLRPGATPLTGRQSEEVTPAKGVVPVWWAAAAPVLTVIFGVIFGMALDTVDHPIVSQIRMSDSFLSAKYWTACFSNANTPRVLFVSAMVGSILAIIIATTRRDTETGHLAIRVSVAIGVWARGIVGVYYAIAILILAWAIKEVCTELGTSIYLTAALSSILSPGLLPLLTFGLASLVAFSIGTSWTTMAILIPTVVPLAHSLGGLPLTALTAAAVLDGAIFGDHCSPISDTTVMSSIASGCDHIDHVKTQLPYALTTMCLAAIVGYLGTSLFYEWWVALPLGALLIMAVLFVFGRNPDILTADSERV